MAAVPATAGMDMGISLTLPLSLFLFHLLNTDPGACVSEAGPSPAKRAER